MSVRTTSDEHLDSARGHIHEAIRDLSQIVVERCWGHDEYNAETQRNIRETLVELISLRVQLGGSD